MKRVSDTIKEVQYRRLLKRSFEPREEFLNSSRELFLAEVAKRRVAPYAPQLAWRQWGLRAVRYSVAFAGLVIVGTSGLVAYADTTNVSLDNPLYPLKRVGEQVRLTVVSAEKEVEVHRELAERRANEFVQIETRKRPDDSGGVVELRKLEDTERELRSEFHKNIEAIDDHSKKQDIPTVLVADRGLCLSAELVDRRESNGKSEQYKRFKDQCKDLLEDDRDAHTQLTDSSDDSRDNGPVRDARNGEDVKRLESGERKREDATSTSGKDRDKGNDRVDSHDELRGERD